MRNNKYKIKWTNLDYSTNKTTEDLLKISGISKKEEYLCTFSDNDLQTHNKGLKRTICNKYKINKSNGE